VSHNNTQPTMSPWSRKSKIAQVYGPKTVFPRPSLLTTMLPFSLLEGVDRFSMTHPFSGFRFCVINHVSASKVPSLIGVTYPMDTRKAHTVPYNELCHHLWDSLAPSLHTFFCNPVGPRQFCALPRECLALWQCQQLNVSVCHAPYLPVCMVLQIYTVSNWHWIFTGATHITHKNQNTLHTSKSAMVPADHPSLI